MSATLAASATTTRLDPRETHHRIPSPRAGLRLFLRSLPPATGAADSGRTVLSAAHFADWAERYLDGDLAYDPGRIRAPVAILRATHLMHLEEGRAALYAATEAFLRAGA